MSVTGCLSCVSPSVSACSSEYCRLAVSSGSEAGYVNTTTPTWWCETNRDQEEPKPASQWMPIASQWAINLQSEPSDIE